ncbi:hypothetical protein AALO_G00115680, partial [Alosa alosa]
SRCRETRANCVAVATGAGEVCFASSLIPGDATLTQVPSRPEPTWTGPSPLTAALTPSSAHAEFVLILQRYAD